MRSLTLTLLLAAVLGSLAYVAIFFWQKTQIDHRHEHATGFQWFCQEFQISEDQRERMQALHQEYFPECQDHCVHYADTRETLALITQDPQLDQSPEHREAARELARLARDADKKFIDFVYQIAQEMDPEQSRRYLQRMKGWMDKAGDSR